MWAHSLWITFSFYSICKTNVMMFLILFTAFLLQLKNMQISSDGINKKMFDLFLCLIGLLHVTAVICKNWYS